MGCKAADEQGHLEYAELAPGDGNFISEYRILVERSWKTSSQLEKSGSDRQGTLRDVEYGKLRAIMFGRLYQPLLYVDSDLIEGGRCASTRASAFRAGTCEPITSVTDLLCGP